MAMSTAKFPRSSWRRAEFPVNLCSEAEQSPTRPLGLLHTKYWLPWKCTVSQCKTPQRAIQITFRISYLHCNGHGRSLNVTVQIWYQSWVCSADSVSEFTSHEHVFIKLKAEGVSWDKFMLWTLVLTLYHLEQVN